MKANKIKMKTLNSLDTKKNTQCKPLVTQFMSFKIIEPLYKDNDVIHIYDVYL